MLDNQHFFWNLVVFTVLRWKTVHLIWDRIPPDMVPFTQFPNWRANCNTTFAVVDAVDETRKSVAPLEALCVCLPFGCLELNEASFENLALCWIGPPGWAQ